MADTDYLDIIGDEGEKRLNRARGTLRDILADMKNANSIGLKLEIDASGAKTLKDVTELSNKLVDINGQLVTSQVKVNGIIAEASTIRNRYGKETSGVLATSTKLIRLNQEEAKSQEAANKALEAGSKARRADALAMEAESKERQALIREKELEIRAEATRQRLAAKGTTEQLGQYDQLRKAYTAAANAAKELGVAEGINSVAFKQAAADARKMYETLYAVESAVGQNQRGVGQYERGSAGLSMAVQQILREAPSAAISLNTFFLAISNNLPILFDEIGKVNKQLAATKAALEEQIIIARANAEAQALQAGATAEMAAAQAKLAEEAVIANAAQAKMPSVFAQIGKSLLSVNTLLTAAVLLLTLFGGKIIDFFRGVSTAGADAEKATKKYQKTLESLAETERNSANQEIAHANVLAKIAADRSQLDKNRLRAVSELQETYPDRFGALTKEAILEGNVADALKRTTQELLNKAAAQAAEKRFAAASENVYDLTLAQRKALEELSKAEKEEAAQRASLAASGYTPTTRDGAKVEKAQAALNGIVKQVNTARKEMFGYLTDAQKFAAQAGDTIFTDPKTKTAKVKDYARQEYQGQKELNDALANLRQQQIEQDKAANTEIFQDETKSFSDRLLAHENFLSDRIYQAEAERDKEIANAKAESASVDKQLNDGIKKSAEQLSSLHAQKEAARVKELAAEQKYQADIGNISAEGAKWVTEATRKELERQRQLRESDLKDYEELLQRVNDREAVDLQDRYLNGEMSTRDYEARIAGLHRKGLLDIAQAEIDFYTKEAARTDLSAKQHEEAVQREIAAEKKKNDILLELQRQYAESRKQIEKELADTIASTTEGVLKSIISREQERNNEAIKGIESQAQAEIDQANRSISNKQEREDRIARINKQAQQAKEVIDEKNKRLARQQADIESTAALIRTGINTFEKVAAIEAQAAVLASNPATAPLAALAYGQIPLVISAGAIAEAGILAQMALQKFATGTGGEFSALGWALTDEEGAEMYQTQSGKTYMGSDQGPTLRYFTEPTKIIPADEVDRMAAQYVFNGVGVMPRHPEQAPDRNAELLQEVKLLRKAIMSLDNAPKIDIHGLDRDYLDIHVFH